jgi:dienelactone hydrolase
VQATRIASALELCQETVKSCGVERIDLIGFSFGGLLAAIFAERFPDRVGNMLLFAPAIDNFERNYQGRPESDWIMPAAFVEELCTYPARPSITRPTTLVHGSLDNDSGGCAWWRIERWASEQRFRKIYLLDGVEHSLEPWLGRQDDADLTVQSSLTQPRLQDLLTELTSSGHYS